MLITALCNRTRVAISSTPSSGNHKYLHSIAFGELIAYIEAFQQDTSIALVFKLAELAHMYTTCLEQLNVEIYGCIHTSRLKLRLFSAIPNLR